MRPKEVTATTWVMGALNLLGYALLLDLQKPRLVILAFVTFTLMIAAGYLVLWFYWRGRNWARILVLVTCFLCFYNLREFLSANLIVKIMLVGEASVAVFLVYWLNTSQAKAFFKNSASRQ
jgi:hypothetical protein